MSRSPARELALTALQRWHSTNQFADRIIQQLLAATPAIAPERAFAQELFYGILRNLTLLDFYIQRLRPSGVDPLSGDLIRLGLFQLFHLQTPTHAAVFETVQLAPTSKRSLVNAVLRNAIRNRDRLLADSAAQPLHIRQSHPEFLVRRWTSAFGKASTIALCDWNNQAAPLYARINSLRTNREDFLARNPAAERVSSRPLFVKCGELPRAALAGGECYMQDPSTELSVNLLNPREGERILDACAAPGGKLFQIADKTADKTSLVACDRDAARLDLLRENLRRLGIGDIPVVQHDWLRDSASGRFQLKEFDKIILDLPCTNTGVMRRRVDVRWRLTPADFQMMADQQFRIVAAVLPLLRSNGTLVYSTCSVEPEENEQMVTRLGRDFPRLHLEAMQSVLPFKDNFDGAFAARFVLKG
jgi:tRNA and rRNA cytosine-C5-methylases